MSKLRTIHYTLVQHSGYAAEGKEEFRNAVEPAGVSTHAELGRIIDAGGCHFTDYTKADDAADAVNQPHLDTVLFPDQADSTPAPDDLTFDATLTVGGRALYLPPNTPASN